MSDYTIAALLLSFLVALAVAAPIWGVDSRDGIESDQTARRVAWLSGGAGAASIEFLARGAGARSTSALMAGLLRSMAKRLDHEAAEGASLDRRIAHA